MKMYQAGIALILVLLTAAGGCTKIKNYVNTPEGSLPGRIVGIPQKSNEEVLRLYLYRAEFSKAHKLADDLSANDDPVGFHFKASLYRSGSGVERDLARAIQLYNRAIEKDYSPALASLGKMHIEQEGGLSDKKHGLELIERGVKNQDPVSETILGRLYQRDGVLKKDDAKALFYFQRAAAKNYPPAYWELARAYHFGSGVKKDENKAREYASKAAEHEYPRAVIWRASNYMAEDQPRKAYDLLEAPLKLGESRAEALMGRLLLHGAKKVNARPGEGLRLLRIAADKGSASAMFDLGWAYESGIAISRSRYLAAEWYSKAAYAFLDAEDPSRESAIRAFEKLEKADPGYATLGDLRSKLGVSQGSNSIAGSDEGHTAGTGWMIEPGYVVTNNHVVEGKKTIKVTFDNGNTFPVRVKSADKNNDIAILEVIGSAKLPAMIPLARTNANAGARVFTIGFPVASGMGNEPKVTEGIISSSRGFRDDPRMYQISVPIQPGNSGGPLLNMKGEAVGVVTSTLEVAGFYKITRGALPQNVNYAVKSDYVGLVSKSLKRTGNYEKLNSQEASLDVLAERVRSSVVRIITE